MVTTRARKYKAREVFRYRDQNMQYQSVSWDELSREIKRVALALDEHGYGLGANIGIFSNNRPEWMIADLAIMTVRGVSVPFFGNASLEQVRYIVDETKMKLMFVGNAEQLEKAIWLTQNTATLETIVLLDPKLNCQSKNCFRWEDFSAKIDTISADTRIVALAESVEPEDLATIIYTSGTTGEPKGVMLGHDNFMFVFDIHDKRLHLDNTDVSLCFLPLSHIFERSWSYYLLHVGATNVFLENPKEVIDVMPVVKPTVMCTVPRFYEKTHEGIQKEYANWPSTKKKIFDWSIKIGHERIEFERQSKPLPFALKLKLKIANKLVLEKLRKIFGNKVKAFPCSGAAIRPELLRYFHAIGIFVNYGYGATETTATVSCFKTSEYEFDSCGTVMPDVSVKFDKQGEIMVKGKTVFKGYYKKPAETAEVLNDGWYRTGDEGHLTPEGNLHMTDRLRDIIKTSVGKFVSPQKIELLLGKDDFVEQVIVIGDNRKYITALIVPAFDHLAKYAKSIGLTSSSHIDLIKDTKIVDFYDDRFSNLLIALASYEKIAKFTLLPEAFSIENAALTNTLKIRRKVIEIKYRNVIEKMYED
jgi:long-chain acyl-CoA synthetase